MSKLNRIKAVLAEQEKTSKWLAEQVGKSACTVSKWCSNSSQPDLQTLARIADILEVDKRDLLTGSSNLTSTAK
ncbi:MAG: helix-turn-helix transcriptional regulator [Paraprevotella sp.]|nr:helix-turn-helix transcriptional regulator [Paraprevotella sp.]